jgi:hypothetical protein
MVESNYKDHRKRLRERFLKGVPASASDSFLLELLLTFAIGRKDVKPLAEELIGKFGSLPDVLSATKNELENVKGLGQASIALLKLVDFIRGESKPDGSKSSSKKVGEGATQQKLFRMMQGEETSKKASSNTKENKTVVPKMTNKVNSSSSLSALSKKKIKTQKSIRRKFQVSNGYLFEFDQLARILHFLFENKEAEKISRQSLLENTGLSNRQIESLVSIGAAIGLIKPGSQILTDTGLLIAEHDIFLESKETLEWCHYIGAGSPRNLIWFELFNKFLNSSSSMKQSELNDALRDSLAGLYTKRTIGKHLYEEVRFVIDVYTERNFKKLELLQRSTDEQLYRRRYSNFNPIVLTAMIYDFCTIKEVKLFQVGEMAATPGSPAVVFGLDTASFRKQIEGLHDRGWLRYETTHNLDQIRLKPGFSAIDFLSAYFEEREPRENTKSSPGGVFQ